MNTASIKKTGLGILIGVLLMIGVQFASAAWTPPPTPPTGNVAAPVNTGSFQQFKNGTFSALRLFTLDLGAFSQLIPTPVGLSVNSSGVKIFDGVTPTPGEVLTVGANNVVTWQPVGLPAGLINQTLRHDGQGWLANSLMRNNGSAVQVSSPTSPIHPILNNISIPTFLTEGNIIATSTPATPQPTTWVFQYDATLTSSVVQISGSNDTPELLNFWQNLPGTHMGVNGFMNFGAARITGPCNDTQFGAEFPVGTDYSYAPQCSPTTYPISGSDTRPYVYELYSQRTVHVGNGGNNGYVEYIFKAIRYKRVAITPPPASSGGNIWGVHGKFNDLSGPDKPVCADADGDLISCDFPATSDPADNIIHVRKDSNNMTGIYAYCPANYIVIGGGGDCENNMEISQPFSLAFPNSVPLPTQGGGSVPAGSVGGWMVQCSGQNNGVHAEAICLKNLP